MTDTWVVTSSASSALLSPTTTPTRRASRNLGISNEVEHTAFVRAPDASSPSLQAGRYALGDTVILSPNVATRQKWLKPPPYLLATAGAWRKGKSPSKAKGSSKPSKGYQGWVHEDGLAAREKVGIIVGLYEDMAKERMMARVRYLARPGAVWEQGGPEDEDEAEPEPFELYYTADSTYVEEAEAHRAWKASPSTSLSRPALKASLCTDNILVSHILRPVHVVASAEERPVDTQDEIFIVRKVYDVKPVGEEFWGDIEWSQILAKGKKLGVWDTGPIVDGVPAKKIKQRKNPIKKPGKTQDDKGKGKQVEVVLEAESSDDDDTAKAPDYVEKPGSEKGESDGDDGEPESESDVDEPEDEDEDGHDSDTPRTPKKRGQSSQGGRSAKRPAVTPSRHRPKLTSQAKQKRETRAKRQRNFKERELTTTANLPPPFTRSDDFKKLSTFEKAKALLHVSATPDNLPGREEQRSKINEILGHAILGQSGTCLYIHGVPGTGKTATVHSVIRDLQKDDEMDAFQFVEINGMKISEPNHAFTLLWESLSGEKCSPRQALASLEEHFQTPDPTRKTTVVLVDELDQMITKKQDVIYNFFNWPHVAHSRLIVIAIANTMDLPERELSGKIRSRLGSNRIPFAPYTSVELQAILEARLDGLHVFEELALTRIARMVSGVSGDARRALDVARRAVEKKDQDNKQSHKTGLCSIADVGQTYKEMTNYGSNLFVRRASLHQKIFLLALSGCVKRAGVPEVEAEKVISWHFDFLDKTAIKPVPSHEDLFTIIAELHSLRLIVTESQRGDYFQRVRSLVEDADLFEILNEESELKNFVRRVA